MHNCVLRRKEDRWDNYMYGEIITGKTTNYSRSILLIKVLLMLFETDFWCTKFTMNKILVSLLFIFQLLITLSAT